MSSLATLFLNPGLDPGLRLCSKEDKRLIYCEYVTILSNFISLICDVTKGLNGIILLNVFQT